MATMWPPSISSTSSPSRSRATLRWKSSGKSRSSRPARTRVGTSGHAVSGHGCVHRRRRLVLPGPALRLGGEVRRAGRGSRGRPRRPRPRRQADGGVIVAHRGPRPGVRPPVVPGLAGPRDHRVEEDEQRDRAAGADDGGGEPAERVGDEDHVLAITDGVDHGVGVLGPAGAVVLRRQPDGDGLGASRQSSVTSGSHCQDRRRHRGSGRRSLIPTSASWHRRARRRPAGERARTTAPSAPASASDPTSPAEP